MIQKLSIIIVEDDPDSCKEFYNYIDKIEDIELLGSTNNSTQAIDYTKVYLPDAIILDLELHNGSGSGLNVLQELVRLSITPKPYILITTNNSSKITFDFARQLGADFIMSKHQKDYSAKNVIDFLKIMAPLIHNQRLASNTYTVMSDPYDINKRIANRISVELNNIGINPKVLGYKYLVEAIQIVIDQPTKNLCSIIGEKYQRTDSSVERAIQNAINKAWRTTDIDDLLKYYTAKINPGKGVPTVLELISYYANKIKNEN
jgi:Response regulator containing a CheY-like receiver domain and an HTH DNA-binding domain